MPVYQYRARNSAGEGVSGELTAASRDEAAAALRDQGLFPSSVEAVATAPPPANVPPAPGLASLLRRVTAADRVMFWTQAWQAASAGIPLARMLDLLAQGGRGPLARFAASSALAAGAGRPLSELMAARHDLFLPLEVGLVRAGEVGGRLDSNCQRLAAYWERDLRTRQALRAPLAYLGCVGLVFCLAAFVVVVVAPSLAARLSGETPSLAARAGRFVLPLLAVGGALLLARAAFAGSGPLRRAVDALKLAVPGVAGLFRRLAIARYAQSLGRLVEAGLPLGEALEIAAGTTGNLHVSTRLATLPARVRDGTPLSVALAETGLFPLQAVQMVATGEETGTTDQMLVKVSEYYDGEAAAATVRLATVGTVVAFLVLALAIGAFALRFFMGLYGEVFSLAEG